MPVPFFASGHGKIEPLTKVGAKILGMETAPNGCFQK